MNNLALKSIEDAIKNRYSVRNYKEEELSSDIIEKIENYIEDLSNPFDIRVRIRFIKKSNYDGVVNLGALGTYGVIKGAKYYLIAACENKEFALEALGYTFEQAILYCTSLGISSVWLGGTFNRMAFSKTINLKDNELLPVVAPIGYEGGEKSFIASFIKNHKNIRKDFSELFFNKDFKNPLKKEDDIYSKALEMVRLAPSSINSQPWRIIKDEKVFHIYSSGKTKMNKIDIGIALCHLDLYLKEKEIEGEFKFIKPNINTSFKYVVSWEEK